MIRLIFWATLFGAGFWFGIKVHGNVMDDRCLDAGGRIGALGLCEGVAADG
ncbi:MULTISPECIES: hypothetical protein [Tropicimonas]|uniref:Uncharacterized protein n=2 Tax=Tropicimonas TaxID=599652 RepID=A0A239CKV9_9RHOB|nr:hypothetical protein [Tropicimonas sediminicola]SNS20338.1 hypothetical protein SAMN05421757_101330 [Tropicimonas sediminicola]